MKTRIISKSYEIIEKDKTGLIPEWVTKVSYNPDSLAGKIHFDPKEDNFPEPSDREKMMAYKNKYFPSFTPEQIQTILNSLESSLVSE